MKKLKTIYKKSVAYLAKHKLPAFILSHGGLHILVLLLCIIGAVFMYGEVQKYNKRTFRQFSFRIEGDTLENYLLTHFDMSIRRLQDSSGYDAIDYKFQYGRKKDVSQPLNTLVCNVIPHSGKIVDAIQQITVTVDDYTVFDKETMHIGATSFSEESPANTAKVCYNYLINKVTAFHFDVFTSGDNIKKSLYTIKIPYLTNDWDSDNPYLCCFYGVHAIPWSFDLDSTSTLTIPYNEYPYKVSGNYVSEKNDMFENAPMTIEMVLPRPTEMTLEKIIYKGKDIEKVFEQGGVYVSAVDPVKKAKANRMEFLWTVLIGTIIAFALDIMVQLVIKWRKLSVV